MRYVRLDIIIYTETKSDKGREKEPNQNFYIDYFGRRVDLSVCVCADNLTRHIINTEMDLVCNAVGYHSLKIFAPVYVCVMCFSLTHTK